MITLHNRMVLLGKDRTDFKPYHVEQYRQQFFGYPDILIDDVETTHETINWFDESRLEDSGLRLDPLYLRKGGEIFDDGWRTIRTHVTNINIRRNGYVWVGPECPTETEITTEENWKQEPQK